MQAQHDPHWPLRLPVLLQHQYLERPLSVYFPLAGADSVVEEVEAGLIHHRHLVLQTCWKCLRLGLA